MREGTFEELLPETEDRIPLCLTGYTREVRPPYLRPIPLRERELEMAAPVVFYSASR